MAQVKEIIKHGRDIYEPEKDYDLDPELEAYFAANGWLVGSGTTEAPTITDPIETFDIEPENAGVFDTVLEVDPSNHGVTDTNG